MPGLSNHQLRKEKINIFLTAMGIDTSKVTIDCEQGLLSFQLKKEESVDALIHQLQLDNSIESAITSIDLGSFIDKELENAAAPNEALRLASKRSFKSIKELAQDFIFSPETGTIDIILPEPFDAYAALPKLLTYSNMEFTDSGRLSIKINKLLNELPQSIVRVNGFKKQASSAVFLKEDIFQTQKVFYASKTLPGGKIEVTPHVFFPPITSALNYYLLLDCSGSMGEHLHLLKKAACNLTEQLFQLQPAARVTLIKFGTEIHNLGTYLSKDLATVKQRINGLLAAGTTPLYDVLKERLEHLLSSSEHNNILLFTDGVEKGSHPESLHLARTQFCFLNYNVAPDDIIQTIVQAFNGKIIQTQSPDFMAAQENQPSMREWAEASDLFSSTITITNRTKNREEMNYFMRQNRFDLGTLEPLICRAGEAVEISIRDGNNDLVAHSSRIIEAPSPSISYAALIAGAGMYPSCSKDSDNNTSASLAATSGAHF